MRLSDLKHLRYHVWSCPCVQNRSFQIFPNSWWRHDVTTLVFSSQIKCLYHRHFQNIFKDHPILGNLMTSWRHQISWGLGGRIDSPREEDVAPVRLKIWRHDHSHIFLFSAKFKCFGWHRKSNPLIPGWDLRGDYRTHFGLKLA